MSLYTVSTGSTINATDVNQLVNVLKQPSGGTESGSYLLSQGCHATGDFVSLWISTLSRGSTPVSVSHLDTSMVSPGNCNSPTSAHLNQNGFQVNTTATGPTTDATVGGAWTVQY